MMGDMPIKPIYVVGWFAFSLPLPPFVSRDRP